MKTDAWETYALESGLNKTQLDGLKSLLSDQNLWKKNDSLVRLFAALDALGVREYVKFDANIVRGLLYYTGTVFEAYETGGSLRRAILGGGRYDNLLADVGGEPLSAVGFAMGDVVIGLVLQEAGLVPEFRPSPASVLVTVFDSSRWAGSASLAADLRRAGVPTLLYPEPAKLPRQLKFADKMKLRLAVVIGPDEAEQGMVVVKDLGSGTQQTLARDSAVESIRAMLK
jgi:histidyl-tRNA synthetase